MDIQWTYIQYGNIPLRVYGNGYPVVRIGGEMQDYLLESLKLQRIVFFIKRVAAFA